MTFEFLILWLVIIALTIVVCFYAWLWMALLHSKLDSIQNDIEKAKTTAQLCDTLEDLDKIKGKCWFNPFAERYATIKAILNIKLEIYKKLN